MSNDSDSHTGLTILSQDRDLMVRLCAHLTGRADVAEDLAQETLTEAWRQRHKLEQPAGQAAWLMAIARNICRRWQSRQGAERRYAGQSLSDRDQHADVPPGEPWADDIDLERTLERQELVQLLDRSLALLPEVTRQALLYHYVEELPQREIAFRLPMSEGASRSACTAPSSPCGTC